MQYVFFWYVVCAIFNAVKILRWIACTGKFDRVQLGSSCQLERSEVLEKSILESVDKLGTMWHSYHDEEVGLNDLDMLQHGIDVLRKELDDDEFKNILLDVSCKQSISGKTVAYIIKSLGFNFRRKFPDNFNFKQAAIEMIAVFAPWTWEAAEASTKCLAVLVCLFVGSVFFDRLYWIYSIALFWPGLCHLCVVLHYCTLHPPWVAPACCAGHYINTYVLNIWCPVKISCVVLHCRSLVKTRVDDAEWSSKIADEVCPEHSLLCQKLVSAFSDAVEFLMAIVSFRQAKEKLQTVCFEKVTRGTSGNAEGNVRLTRKKLLSITSDLQSSAPKELIEKVQECYKEKHESGKKKRKKKQCNPGYKRQAGDELRTGSEKRDCT